MTVRLQVIQFANGRYGRGATACPFFHSDKNRQRQKLTGGSLLCEDMFRSILPTQIDFGLLDMEVANLPTALSLGIAFNDLKRPCHKQQWPN
jgi:hypothetical protein